MFFRLVVAASCPVLREILLEILDDVDIVLPDYTPIHLQLFGKPFSRFANAHKEHNPHNLPDHKMFQSTKGVLNQTSNHIFVDNTFHFIAGDFWPCN